MVDIDPLAAPVTEERELENIAPEEKLEAAMEGRGSGISTESSVIPPRRAVSAVQLFSFTMTGFDLCQDKLVTA